MYEIYILYNVVSLKYAVDISLLANILKLLAW